MDFIRVLAVVKILVTGQDLTKLQPRISGPLFRTQSTFAQLHTIKKLFLHHPVVLCKKLILTMLGGAVHLNIIIPP